MSDCPLGTPHFSLIIPTYNESENIVPLLERVIRQLRNLAFEVIVVDDHSPDGTASAVADFSKNHPQVKLINRFGERGLSGAVLEGFRAAQGDILGVMDADLSHDETILPQLIAAVKNNGADLAIGTRRAPGGGTEGWPWYRKALSTIATGIAHLALRMNLTDPMSGYFVLKRHLYEKTSAFINPKGYKILLEIYARSRPLQVTEVPYIFKDRKKGYSKLRLSVLWAFLNTLVGLRLNRRDVLIGGCLFLALFCLVWRRLLMGLVPLDGNMITIAYPDWSLFHRLLHDRTLPLWNPYRDMGEPFLADPQTMSCYPLMWLLYPLSYLNFLRVWYAFHTLLLMSFMSALVYKHYKDFYAAVTAGIVMAFNGYITAHNMPNVFATAAWLPAALYYADQEAWVGTGLVLGLQWLAGFPDFACVSVFAVLLLAATKGKRGILLIMRAGFLAIGLAAIQFLPFIELLRLSERGILVSARHSIEFSIPFWQLLMELFAPVWMAYAPDLSGDAAITSFYMGLVALGLAFYGSGRGRRERACGVAALVCLALSLGAGLPGYKHISLLHFFRFPAHWLLLATTALAFLTGAGFASLPKSRVRWMAFFGIGVDLVLFAQYPRIAWFDPSFVTTPPPILDHFRAIPYLTRIYHTDGFERLWLRQEIRTVDGFLGFRTYLVPSYNMAFGIGDVQSQQVLCLRRAFDFQRRLAAEGPNSSLVKEAGISLVVEVQKGAERITPDTVHLVSLKDPGPPLFLNPSEPQDDLHWVWPSPQRLHSELKSDHAATLVFNQVYFPGWRCFVDGHRTAVKPFEETFLSIPVAQGEHQIDFEYASLPLKIGAVMSAMSLVLIFALV